jgi:uncharacterized protein YkwD
MTYNRSRSSFVVCVLLSTLAACHMPENTTAGDKRAAVTVQESEIDVRLLPTEPGLSDPNCGLNGVHGIELELLQRVNAFRSEPRMCGTRRLEAAPPLKWNLRLLNASYRHSVDMARSNLVSHTSLDSRELWNRLDQAAYPFLRAGENIAAGQNTVEKVVLAWQQSPHHCATMMMPEFLEIGVACVYKKSSFYKYYWTMDLGRAVTSPLIPAGSKQRINPEEKEKTWLESAVK